MWGVEEGETKSESLGGKLLGSPGGGGAGAERVKRKGSSRQP